MSLTTDDGFSFFDASRFAAAGRTMLGEGDVPRGAGAVQEDVGRGVRCDESAGTVTRQIGMSNRERQASILSEIAEADEAARHVPRHARVGGCETSRKFADIEAHGF